MSSIFGAKGSHFTLRTRVHWACWVSPLKDRSAIRVRHLLWWRSVSNRLLLTAFLGGKVAEPKGYMPHIPWGEVFISPQAPQFHVWNIYTRQNQHMRLYSLSLSLSLSIFFFPTSHSSKREVLYCGDFYTFCRTSYYFIGFDRKVRYRKLEEDF